ncbi:DNA polymerase-3 subunit epsilon [Methylobacterium phyllostachyos]|uniref:DNA polymerase-3 subunit epsilon n=1 Tax=Methylobacterium phyllostachyos TaxID=582672 RepID=A0A1H0HUT4_9HYPH|nr:3'-5' exonuclease [Methylobacterium phyllostachyos]SDO22531.1 DNA polymerase-3 subunit epsilon [Methylobacterium phyllostachyos]
MLDIDPELVATALERSSDYRVLRRHHPRRLFEHPGDAEIRHGLLIDLETTGLDPNYHEVIEIGLVPFTYTVDGRLVAAEEPYGSFQQPWGPILPEITRLTGIDSAMVEGHMIERSRVEAMVERADLIVAHNASFDRPFAEDVCPALKNKPWGCSLQQVPWAAEGMGSKLSYIASDLGLIFSAHRAVDDCQATLECLSRPLPRSGRTGFSHLLEQAFLPVYRVKAVRAPYEAKDLLKARRYRWDDGSVSQTRCWFKDLPEDEVGLELEWLRREAYRYDANVPIIAIDPCDRFSARV